MAVHNAAFSVQAISTTCAPSAIKSGMLSPIGEPLATLPPSVPDWRTGQPAKRSPKGAITGRSAASASNASCKFTAAPMAMCCG